MELMLVYKQKLHAIINYYGLGESSNRFNLDQQKN